MPNQTGPKTKSGKLASCMNRLKHSACAESLFIKGENPDDFFSLLENAFEQYQPAFDQDAILVTRSVQANWILMRRERISAEFETALYERKPGGRHLVPKMDLDELFLFDRYTTAAQRAFRRALLDVQLIQKMENDNERWQLQLAAQKAKLTPEAEPMKTDPMKDLKRKVDEDVISTVTQNNDVAIDEYGAHIPQAVFVANENGTAEACETVPSNAEVRRIIATAQNYPTPPTEVVRTYVFAGLVPPEFHWLITEDWQREIEDQELRKTLSFDDWRTLTANE